MNITCVIRLQNYSFLYKYSSKWMKKCQKSNILSNAGATSAHLGTNTKEQYAHTP